MKEERAGEGEAGERLINLEINLAEREEEKGNLQLRVLELEETINSEVGSYLSNSCSSVIIVILKKKIIKIQR